MTTKGLDPLTGFADDLVAWATAVDRVPSYRRIVEELVPLLAGSPAAAAIASSWRGRPFEARYDRPLLLFASLRCDALAEGPSHPLWPAIAGEPPRPEALTADALAAALVPERHRLHSCLSTRAVQTNETSRAVAWLWPARLLDPGGARPLALVDVGASAGLNLVADRLPAIWTEAAGAPLDVARAPDVRLRLGFDRAPLDVRDDADVSWLEACIWPGERRRQDRLRQAVAAMRALAERPIVERADATEIPDRIAERTRDLPADVLVVAYQTLMIDYLPPSVRAAYVAGMEALVARTPATVWVEIEQGAPPVPGHAAVVRATWRGRDARPRTAVLAGCDYHPSVIAPDPAAVAALQAAFA